MTHRSTTPFSDEALDAAVEHLRVEGWAHLPNVATPGALDALRTRADDLLTGRVRHEGLFYQPDSPTGRYEDLVRVHGWAGPDRVYRKLEKLDLDPLFRAWLADPLFGRLAARVIASRVTLYRAVLFNKAPRIGSDTPWHQDGGKLWGLDRDPLLQIWTALDDAFRAAGCVEVLPRSHERGLATPLGGVVPTEQVLAADAAGNSVALEVRAGDVLLLHNLVWHRSGPNTTDLPRRGFTTCYLHGDTRCLRTRRAPRSFVPVFA